MAHDAAAAAMADVLDKRLLFITGKGGVGKSTVASALGLAAARRGKRVIVCELAQQERVSRLFRDEGVGFEETELATNLAGISIDPQRALEEYLSTRVPSRPLRRLLFQNRVFGYFVAAAPGAKEIVSIGKVWELAQLERPWSSKTTRYDLVVVDAPATGHGLGILHTPRTIRDIARVGPIRRQAERIDDFIRDARQTGVVGVALPEEMPVTETIEFRARLREELGMAVDAVVVNGLYPERFGGDDERALERAARDGSLAAPAIRAALAERRRALSQRSQLRRLRREVGSATTLPYLFEPEVGLAGVERLSRELERRL